MKHFLTSTRIAAPVSRAWEILSDVERWPEWTPSVTSIVHTSSKPLGVGSRVKIHQPKLLPATWEITAWEAGSHFTWIAKGAGIRATAEHVLQAEAGGCSVTLRIRFEGVVGRIVARLAGQLTQHYLELEAAGLKRLSEERAKGQLRRV